MPHLTWLTSVLYSLPHLSQWLTSVLYSLPHLVFYDTVYIPRQATTDWDDVQTTASAVVADADVFCINSRRVVTRVYILVNFAALYVTPLTLMTFVYARISLELWRSGSQPAAAVSSCRLSSEARRTRTPRGGSLRNPSYVGHSSTGAAQSPSAPPTQRWSGQHQQIDIEMVAVEPGAPVDDGITTHEEPTPRRRAAVRQTAAAVTVFVQNNPLRSRRKVIRLLIAFVVTFAVCMLPNHVWLLWQEWADLYQQYESSGSYQQYESYSYEHFMYVPPVMTLLFYVNSCLNPFLYALISDKFRSAVSDAVCLRRCCRRSPADDLRCVAKSVPPAPPAQPGDESL